jgi:hypothetical protein
MKEPYDKNIFGPMGMKDTQFPVNQDIQSPVLPTSNIHDLGKWGPIFGRVV